MEERARCDMVESFAERLKRIRESKGLTKYRLAKLSGMDIAYVSQLEQGEVKHPRYDTLKSLARGLEVSVGELAGESPRTPDELLSDFESAMKAYIPVYDSCCLVKNAPRLTGLPIPVSSRSLEVWKPLDTEVSQCRRR